MRKNPRRDVADTFLAGERQHELACLAKQHVVPIRLQAHIHLHVIQNVSQRFRSIRGDTDVAAKPLGLRFAQHVHHWGVCEPVVLPGTEQLIVRHIVPPPAFPVGLMHL